MSGWLIIAHDHGSKAGELWFSRAYATLDEALLDAAWLQQRDRLFGYQEPFTVVETWL